MFQTRRIGVVTVWLLLSVAQSVRTASAADTPGGLSFPNSDLLDLYSSSDPPLRHGSSRHTDKTGRQFIVRSGKAGAGCRLFEVASAQRPLGVFSAPSDTFEGDRCEYLGGSPSRKGESAWVLAGAFGEYCGYPLDQLRDSLEHHETPKCAVELPTATNPPGGAPNIVGWLSNTQVVLKTAYCCGSYRYHFVDLASGKIVGLGMSFDDNLAKNGKYPVLRPWTKQRLDYWIVQRAEKEYAEWPATIAVVHCANVARYLERGEGFLHEIRVDQRKIPAGATLTVPAEIHPCPPGIGPW